MLPISTPFNSFTPLKTYIHTHFEFWLWGVWHIHSIDHNWIRHSLPTDLSYLFYIQHCLQSAVIWGGGGRTVRGFGLGIQFSDTSITSFPLGSWMPPQYTLVSHNFCVSSSPHTPDILPPPTLPPFYVTPHVLSLCLKYVRLHLLTSLGPRDQKLRF